MLSDVKINIPGGIDFALPRMLPARQHFERHTIADVAGAVREQVARAEISATVKPGASIAIGVGSRGVANIDIAVKALVAELKARGAEPFVFPAMGSHGGGDAEAQAGLLAGYGVSESEIGAPVRATMETVVVAETDQGIPIHMDKYAHAADGVVVINRVKPHTSYRGPVESGVQKMMIIGMGKIAGASAIHGGYSMDDFGSAIPHAASVLMARIPFLFGIGLVEDAFDTTAIVEAMTPDGLFERESALQARSKELMARLMIDDIDVLVVDEIGKNISGSGADPNVTGRNARGAEGFDKPRVRKMVLLDLNDATKGNATGFASADVITQRLYDRTDLSVTLSNVVTSSYLESAKIPLTMKDGDAAVRIAVKTLHNTDPMATRIVRIRNTLELVDIHVSEPMLDEITAHPRMEAAGEPSAMTF